MVEYFMVRGIGAGLRVIDRRGDRAFDRLLDRLARGATEGFVEALSQCRDLIAGYPPIEFRLAADAVLPILARTDMVVPAVGFALQKTRPGARADCRDRLGSGIEQSQRIATFDPAGGNAIGFDARAKAGAGKAVLDTRVDRVRVVLTHEQNGKRLERREIHAFMEDAFIRGALAEEIDDDPRTLACLQ